MAKLIAHKRERYGRSGGRYSNLYGEGRRCGASADRLPDVRRMRRAIDHRFRLRRKPQSAIRLYKSRAATFMQ